jgi:hypothetical protein
LIFGFFFKILAGSSFGRKLLLGHPKLFTYGIFSHDGPTPKQLKETSFEMTLFTAGYSSPSIASSENKNKPDKNIVVRVRGPEPGVLPFFTCSSSWSCACSCSSCFVLLRRFHLPTSHISFFFNALHPGYVATPMFFVQCYKTLIEEVLPESRPSTVHSRGGVLTPAVVFAGTTLVNRLRNRGIDFVVAK